MGRSQETNSKKEVRNKKLKKKKEKEKKKQARKENKENTSQDDMIAYVNPDGSISSTPPDPEEKEETKLEDIKTSTPKNDDTKNLDPIRKGVVTFYNDNKGFGFIKDSETQESVFVHVNNTLEDIDKGNAVIFEVEAGPKGPTAVNVKLNR